MQTTISQVWGQHPVSFYFNLLYSTIQLLDHLLFLDYVFQP